MSKRLLLARAGKRECDFSEIQLGWIRNEQ